MNPSCFEGVFPGVCKRWGGGAQGHTEAHGFMCYGAGSQTWPVQIVEGNTAFSAGGKGGRHLECRNL